MRVCPVCRTPNPPTAPVCINCNYSFLAARESRLRAPESLPPPPTAGGFRATPAQPRDPGEFEEFDLGESPPPLGRMAPAARPLQVPPGPGGSQAARGPVPKKPPRRSTFPRVPKDIPEGELEPLRYDAMKKSLLCVLIVVVVSLSVPFLLGALGITIRFIGIVGVINYVVVLIFFVYVRAVAKASKKPISPVEQSALAKVKGGGALLIAIPLLGSVTGQVGVYFQTNPMHPIYYALAAAGIFYTLAGVTSLKERYSYFAVFEFGFLLLLLQPLPAVMPGNVGNIIFVNVYWFQTTLLFLALGFIAIALALRKMRAGQYDALEQEVIEGQKELESRRWDAAIAHFDRAVTIAHSLYSDKLFKATRTGQRVLPTDYYLPWVGKATALALSGRGPKALTILDIILEVDATNGDLWLNKGEVLMSLGRPAEAYIAFEAAQRLNPALPRLAQLKASSLDLIRRRVE